MRCWGEVIRQKFQEQNSCLHGVVTRSCFLWTHVRSGRFFSVDLGNLGCRMNLALTLGARDFIGGREQIKFTAVCLLTTGDPGAIAHFGDFGTSEHWIPLWDWRWHVEGEARLDIGMYGESQGH